MVNKSVGNKIIIVIFLFCLLLMTVCLCIGVTYSRNENYSNSFASCNDEIEYYRNYTENTETVATSGDAAYSTDVMEGLSQWSIECEEKTAILKENGTLTWNMTNCVNQAEIETEILFLNGDDFVVYDGDFDMAVEPGETENGYTVSLTNVTESKMPAGTYMLRITQSVETDNGNTESITCDIPFFVNYR